MSDVGEVSVRIQGAGYSDAELADLSRGLRADLLQLDIDDARAASAGPAPGGAKAGEAIAYGALLLSLAPIMTAGVVDVLSSWLRRQPMTIELEVEGLHLKGTVTAKQRDALMTVINNRLNQQS